MKNARRRLKKEIANAGALPHGDQVTGFEEGENDDKDDESSSFDG